MNDRESLNLGKWQGRKNAADASENGVFFFFFSSLYDSGLDLEDLKDDAIYKLLFGNCVLFRDCPPEKLKVEKEE